MDKQTTIEKLGISERTLWRYVKTGKVRATYSKGKGEVETADFNDEDVQRLLDSKTSVSLRPVVTTTDTALSQAGIAQLFELLAARLEGPKMLGDGKQSARPAVPVADKVLLSLDECAALSGLSKGYLRDAIKQGLLKGQIIGRGWKVKRQDFDAFIKRL